MRKLSVVIGAGLIVAVAAAIGTRRAESTAVALGAPPTISVSATAAIVNVRRIGVDLGSWTYYGAEQFSANVLMNPGFEPNIDRAIVIVHDTSAAGFSDDSSWLGRPNNFWSGATFQVRTGHAAGYFGTIASSLQSASDGLPWFSTVGPAPALAAGDVISILTTQKAGVPANWWVPESSTGYVAINTSDHRPGSPGRSVAQLTLQNGQSTEIDSYLDSMDGTDGATKFLPINGPWQLSFWSRASSGTPSMSVRFSRLGSSSSFSFVSQSIAVSAAWQQTIINFTASDTAPPGTLALSFIASGAAGSNVRLDDVTLERASDLPNAFRAEVVGALTALHPAYLRDWQSQLGDTLTNRLVSTFARSPSRYRPDPDGSQQLFLYSLPDFLALCNQIGAQPWIVIPTTLYDSEFAALGSYLANAQASYKFNEIVLEFGNENWNSDFRPAGIENPVPMGQLANRAFAVIQQAAGSSVPLHFEVNSQFVNPWIGQQAIANAPLANAADVGPYFFYTLNAGMAQSAAIASMMIDDEGALIAQLATTTTPLGKAVDVYEVNLSTFDGDAPESQRTPLVAGAVSGTALARRLMLGMNTGILRQCVWSLSQYDNYLSASAGYMRLFGITHDLTTAGSFRPTGLAVEMMNQAIGGDFHPVNISGATGLTAVAFRSSAGWSMAIASSNPAATNVAIAFPSGATQPTRLLTLNSSSITATNETEKDVTIAQTQLAQGFQSVSIPAYGLIVLLPPGNPS
jgi:hypothetical protein